jgi:hypothetical protein
MAHINTGDRWLDAELKREQVRLSVHKAQVYSGVRRSGMGDEHAFRARTLAEIAVDADKARAAHERFQASPRGRFLRALAEIEQMPTYEGNAYELRGIYSRSLADDRQPLDVAAVGAAITLLNDVPGKDARAALDALAELLMQTQARAA